MGGAPYIGLKHGGGPKFEVAILCSLDSGNSLLQYILGKMGALTVSSIP